MQRWTSRRQPRYLAEINLVPYMDLVFLLLFITILVVPLLKSAPPPAPGPAPALPQSAVVLELQADGSVLLAGRKLATSGMEAELKSLVATRPGSGFIIKTPAQLPMQKVVPLADLLRRVGAQRVAFQTLPLGGTN